MSDESIDPVAFDQLAEISDGDRGFESDLFREFLAAAEMQLESLEAALREFDHDLAARSIHSLKGGSGAVCAFPLAEACRSLESALRSGGTIPPALLLVREKFAEFVRFAKAYLEEAA